MKTQYRELPIEPSLSRPLRKLRRLAQGVFEQGTGPYFAQPALSRTGVMNMASYQPTFLPQM
ncbi:hypothetical protein CKO42_15115 [Lamprobacter modestohalophilus]|uniref:Uncharacterized protein n=1 Tax=Lamprobacter modestohalophilus TaxID=1064514 RepID=A0A9X0WAB2_9GAMM|nr:hypothetical protein [Lamprobacter modestohalophilus]